MLIIFRADAEKAAIAKDAVFLGEEALDIQLHLRQQLLHPDDRRAGSPDHIRDQLPAALPPVFLVDAEGHIPFYIEGNHLNGLPLEICHRFITLVIGYSAKGRAPQRQRGKGDSPEKRNIPIRYEGIISQKHSYE